MSGDLSLPAADEPGDDLLILVPKAARPDAERVRALCAGAEFLDALGPELPDDTRLPTRSVAGAIALQRSGLTFDLAGLAPGPAVPVPDMGAALPEGLLPAQTTALSLRPGPHTAAGRRTLAVLREWFALARGLGEAFGAEALCWAPGGVVVPLASAERHIAAWEAAGRVPVALLASFHPTLDGALQSHGLAYFTGQELRIEPPLVDGGEQALARVLFTHLFYVGEQATTGQLAAPGGHTLRLDPSDDGRFVRVWPG